MLYDRLRRRRSRRPNGCCASTPKLSRLLRKRRIIFIARRKVSPVWLNITNSSAPRQFSIPRENAFISSRASSGSSAPKRRPNN